MLRQRRREYLFYAAFAIYMARVFIVNSNLINIPVISSVVLPSHYLTFLLSVVKLSADFLEGLISRKKMAGILCGYFGTVVIFGMSGDIGFFVQWTLICSAFDINYQKLAKVAAISMAFSLALIYGGARHGFIKNDVRTAYGDGLLKLRSSMGFNFYFTAAHYTFYFVVTYVFMRREKITLVELVALAVLQEIVFINTNTKNPFAVGMVVLMASAFLRISPWLREYKKVYGDIATFIHPFCAGLILIASFLYREGDKIWEKLNKFVSSRLYLGHNAFNAYGVTLFGQEIIWSFDGTNGPYNILDSSYVCTFFERGVIFFLLVLIMLVAMGRMSIKKKDTYFVLLTSAIAIHATFDEGLTIIPLNILMMFMSYMYVSPWEFNPDNGLNMSRKPQKKDRPFWLRDLK